MTGVAVSFRHVDLVWSPGTPWSHHAIVDLSFDVAAESRVAVVGANGAGKSTVVQLVAGLVRATNGEVQVDNALVRRGGGGLVGLAVQHPRTQLLRATPSAEVRTVTGWSRSDPRIIDALDTVGLDGPAFLRRTVDSMSGGEQRRLQLALQLVKPAPLLVLDEPFAGIDADGRPQLAAVIAHVLNQTRSTLLMVSHDLHESGSLVERVITLDAGSLIDDQQVVS